MFPRMDNGDRLIVSRYRLPQFFEDIACAAMAIYCSSFFTDYIRYAQRFPVRNYGMKDGLSHSTMFGVVQDKRGFIWFSTSCGVCCFDGKTFKSITSEDGLTQNIILSISEDASGLKYARTYGGGIDVINDNTAANGNSRMVMGCQTLAILSIAMVKHDH